MGPGDKIEISEGEALLFIGRMVQVFWLHLSFTVVQYKNTHTTRGTISP